MRGALTREQRLETSITQLKASNAKLRAGLQALRHELRAKDRRIADLEGKLAD